MTRSRAAAVTSLVTTAVIALVVVVASVPAGSPWTAKPAAATAEPPVRLADLGTLAALPAPAPPLVRKAAPPSQSSAAGMILEWDNVTDRMIEEML